MPTLPPGLVSSLRHGDLVMGVDGVLYLVRHSGPDALVLFSGFGPEGETTFGNEGHRAYSWAYYAAPRLAWLLDS